MNRRDLIRGIGLSIPAICLSKVAVSFPEAKREETMLKGVFEPTWESLAQYRVPEWFRDAKFGIWAHWGPQCQPEMGDWYARGMYQEGSNQYKFHLKKYGHPSKFGFKDVIHIWKAENWDPEELLALYKRAGARYFMALANHHDNFDLFKSRYQSWNSVKIGPKKDLIAGWSRAARNQGLHFGVSVHASHAWTWYETAQRSDQEGALKGVPYDGKLTRNDGKGKWWDGLDPQELYAQNHPLSENSLNNNALYNQWVWGNGAAKPSEAYCEKFFNRVVNLINNYNLDLLYFDDTALPLWPVSDAGLRIAAHFYNKSIQKYGSLQAVINGKVLDEEQRKCMVWDIERGQSNTIEPLAWQTDTCIGSWHYNRPLYENKKYKSARTVIQTLTDVVSKNGNLLLSIPVRGDGTIDELERTIVEEIGDWMKINEESIYDTRPWKVFGEGPALEGVAPISAQGFNEGKNKPFTAEDIRFAVKGDVLYATFMGWPESGKITVRSLSAENQLYSGVVHTVEWLNNGQNLKFDRDKEGLTVWLPKEKPSLDYANVLKIR